MKKSLFSILCLLVLSPALSRAETITHIFGSGATFTGNKLATMADGYAYSCGSSSAVFGKDVIYNTFLSLNLLNSFSSATTSPAIEGLTSFRIYHYPVSVCSNILVYVSTDGSSWGAAISGDAIEYGAGLISVTVPRGNYYVKVANSTATQVSIFKFIYTTEQCNCFEYIPE